MQPGDGGTSFVDRRRHRDRDDGELDPARARLHALRPDARRRLPRHRPRLLHRRHLDARRSAPSSCSREGCTEAADCPRPSPRRGPASAFALLAVTMDEADEAFANMYSTAVSIQNLVPQRGQRVLVVGVAALATIGALIIEHRRTTRASCSCSARSSFRSSACCSRTGFSPERATRSTTSSRASRCGSARSSPGSPGSRCTSGCVRSARAVGGSRRARRTRLGPDRLVAPELRARVRAGVRPGLLSRRNDRGCQCEDALYLVEVGADAEEDAAGGARARTATVDRPRPVEVAPDWVSACSWTWTRTARPWSCSSIASRRLLVSHDAGSTLAGARRRTSSRQGGRGRREPGRPGLRRPQPALSSRGTAASSGARSQSSCPKIRDVAWG